MQERKSLGVFRGTGSVDSGGGGGDNGDMSRLYNLERRTDKIEVRLTHIASDVLVLKQDVSVLKQDVSVLKQDVSVLKQDVSVLKQDVLILKQDVSILKSDVSIIKNDMSFLKTAIVSIDAKLDIAGIRATVEKAHTDIYKWAATLAISLIAVMATLYFSAPRVAYAHDPATQIQSSVSQSR
jgi:archaellum component FlaC